MISVNLRTNRDCRVISITDLDDRRPGLFPAEVGLTGRVDRQLVKGGPGPVTERAGDITKPLKVKEVNVRSSFYLFHNFIIIKSVLC